MVNFVSFLSAEDSEQGWGRKPGTLLAARCTCEDARAYTGMPTHILPS